MTPFTKFRRVLVQSSGFVIKKVSKRLFYIKVLFCQKLVLAAFMKIVGDIFLVYWSAVDVLKTFFRKTFMRKDISI